jgi:predicted DCC family thiol-disulfide oxidoreductase YuxK
LVRVTDHPTVTLEADTADIDRIGKCTVYFDGACPLCAREVALYQNLPGSESVIWCDASAEAAVLGEGLDPQRALARLHVRRMDGQLLDGAPAFAFLWRQFPLLNRLGRIASHPLLTHLSAAMYELFLVCRPALQRLAKGRLAN